MTTAQQIFDKTARHLAKQGRRSMSPSRVCLYRGRLGSMCAVGCLIKDGEYRKTMEGYPVRELARRGMLPARLMSHIGLLASLQKAHDGESTDSEVRAIKTKLSRIAGRLRLSKAVLNKLTFPEVWK